MAGVKYRGLNPQTALARWGLAAVAVGIVLGVTAPATAQAMMMRRQAGTPSSFIASENTSVHCAQLILHCAYCVRTR